MASPTPRPGILSIEPYVGGKSALPGQAKPIKLSSNEGALGPSPRALDAARKAAETMHRYPEGGSTDLRAAIAEYDRLNPPDGPPATPAEGKNVEPGQS